jgi:hypothetical protein
MFWSYDGALCAAAAAAAAADLFVRQDNSGTIERDEFLSLPQISSNPLATRYVFCPASLATHDDISLTFPPPQHDCHF